MVRNYDQHLVCEEVRASFYYAPETGLLYHKVDKGCRRVADTVAGCLSAKGYIVVGYKGRVFMAHRIIWMLMSDDPIPEEIDHKNRRGDDNRWKNLRPATHRQNVKNARRFKSNTGVRGVSLNHGRGKPYRAQIQCDGVKRHLGLFDTIEEAQKIYQQTAEKLFGEFAGVT